MFNSYCYFIEIFVFSQYIECNYKSYWKHIFISFIISIILLVGDQYQRCNHLLESICLMEHRIEQRNITTSDGSIWKFRFVQSCISVISVDWMCCLLHLSLPEEFWRHSWQTDREDKSLTHYISYKCPLHDTTLHYIL